MNTKKFFSIALSFILLITSNVSVFAYSQTDLTLTKHDSFYDEMRELDKIFEGLNEKIRKIENGSISEISKMTYKKLQNQIHQIRDKYLDLIRQMEIQSDNFAETTRAVMSADDNIIRQISHNYYNFPEWVDMWWKYIESSLDFAVDNPTHRTSYAISSFSINMKKMENYIKNDLKTRYALFKKEKTSLFKAIEEVTKDMPKEDIYKMTEAEFDIYLKEVRNVAANNFRVISDAMNTGNRELLILKAGETAPSAPSARQLAKQIQFHLRNIGKAKPGFINRLKLIKSLKRFANDVDGRIEYVSKVTRLDPLEVKIGDKVVKTERGLSSALRSAGPLVVIGVVLTAATIVDVNAQNIFPKGANSARRMANIKNAIENDLDISASDALDFYVGHFDENESIIENSNAHYMNMVRILALAQQAYNDKDEIFNILEVEDPSLADVDYSQVEKINDALDKFLGNNAINQQILTQELM